MSCQKKLILAGLGAGFFASACSTVPQTTESDPKELIVQACRPGSSVKSVKGSVWLKAQSTEAKGQFPAVVLAEAPAKLRLEVTNLVGGTEAVIDVEGSRYSIEVPGKGKGQAGRSEKGSGSWGGIPLRWSTELFLGRMPCPEKAEIDKAALSVNSDGELVVETRSSIRGEGERFVYNFRSWNGTHWPDKLHWERKGAMKAAVDFKFDDPEDKTGSPKKWEAKSDRGEVKVRWRDRDAQ